MKIGETFDKIGKPGNFEEVNFFPVSAPDHEALLSIFDKVYFTRRIIFSPRMK